MAFHPYPQLIQSLFNDYWFGPSRSVTFASPWSWIDHPVSGLLHLTIALLRLAFATATPNGLTLLNKVTRRLIMQKVRGHTCLRRIGNIVLPLIVGLRFHILFHSPHRGAFHLSLTVLVHYRSSMVFSLRRWSSQIPTRFLVSRGTRVSNSE